MENETTRKGPSSPATELAKVVAEIGVKDVAREVGYSPSAIHKMIRENETRPVVENWARLYRSSYEDKSDPDQHEIVICRVTKAQASQLNDFVTLMLKGRTARFTDR